MVYPGFCGPSYQSQSPIAANEALVNWYVAKLQAGATVEYALYPTPGVTEFTSVVSSPIRGIFGQSDQAWAVAAGTLQEVFAAGTMTSRGAVNIDGYPATLCTNGDGGNELFVTSGDTGYILNLSTNTLTSVVADVTMGAMVDGYFLALDIASSTLKISDLLDGLTWDPTQILQRSDAPDPWRALIVGANSKIYLLGERTSSVLYDAGAFPFPFVPIQGALIPYGIAGPFAAALLDGTPVWLAQNVSGDRQVVRATGYSSAEVISNEALSHTWSQYARVDDAEAFTFQMDGHEFFVLSFPSANATWGYHDEGGWFQLGFWNSTLMRFDAWHPRCHAYIFNQHLVGDRNSGTIYTLSADVATDTDGNGIRRLRRPPALRQEGKRLIINRFAPYLETGLGLISGQGSNPQLMLRCSQDGGKTWGTERWRTAGALGAYQTQPDWWGLGSARQWQPELVVTDPVPWRILGADVDVTVGLH